MGRATLFVLVAFAIPAAAARADGDPASDYLVARNVFFPFDKPGSPAAQARLNDAVSSAWVARLPIRVAIIATRYDLGSVPVLYRQPQRYAQFLAQEIAFAYTGRLLVVMPNGYGYHRGRVREHALIEALPPPGSTGDALVAGANRAVRRLLALHHIPLQTPQPPKDTMTRDRIEIAVAAVLAAVACGIGWRLMQARRGVSPSP